MTDSEFHELCHLLHVQKRREAISGLLAGNDTCCFTVDQYRYKLANVIGGPRKPNGSIHVIDPALAIKQLRDESTVEEVLPGVWKRKREVA